MFSLSLSRRFLGPPPPKSPRHIYLVYVCKHVIFYKRVVASTKDTRSSLRGLTVARAQSAFYVKTSTHSQQFVATTLPSPSVVIRRINHLAYALPRRAVARSVRERAIVEAIQVLAVVTVVPRVAHAARDRELHGAPPIERAVVRAILRNAKAKGR